MGNRKTSGIFNCGTGVAEVFSAIPEIMSEYCSFDITEIDMPKHLVGKYQKFTRADTDKLVIEAGYDKPFHSHMVE